MRAMRIHCWAIAIGLLLLGGFATAQAPPFFKQATVAIIPPNPTTRDNVQARVTVTVVLPNPCYQVSFSPLGKIGNVFRASVIVTPIARRICPPVVTEITQSRLYTLGKLQQGSYRFEFYGCIKAPNDNVCLLKLLAAKEFQVRKP